MGIGQIVFTCSITTTENTAMITKFCTQNEGVRNLGMSRSCMGLLSCAHMQSKDAVVAFNCVYLQPASKVSHDYQCNIGIAPNVM